MYLTAMIGLAAAGAEPAAEAAADFRLNPLPGSERILPQACGSARPGEIVVCGRERDRDRLGELKPPSGIEERRGGAIGTDFAGGRLGPDLQEVEMPGGRVSKRIMVTWKLPF